MTAISAMRHCDKAVAALAAYLADATHGFVAQLRAVETTLGLTAGALPDPVDIISTSVPRDNASPLIQVYDEGWQWAQPHRQKVMHVDCAIIISRTSDADIEAAEVIMRRYVTAMSQVFEYDSTLGGNVTGAALIGGEAYRSVGDKSATRHITALNVRVEVDSP